MPSLRDLVAEAEAAIQSARRKTVAAMLRAAAEGIMPEVSRQLNGAMYSLSAAEYFAADAVSRCKDAEYVNVHHVPTSEGGKLGD